MSRLLGFIALFFIFVSSLAQGQNKTDEIQMSTHRYSDTLDLDFYTLTSQKDNASRPLVVLLYGGGFVGGRKDGPGEIKFSKTMASFGYAAVSINYALTRKGTKTGFGCDCPAKDKMETFKRAAFDVVNAVEYLKKGDFNFDAKKIILVGSSAGAEAILHAAYQQRHPFYSDIFPEDFEVAAAVSFAGAITDARYINKDTAIPGLFIHGEADNLVPFGTDAHHFCDTNKPGFIMLDGAETIAHKLKELNTSYALYRAPEGKHEWSGIGFNFTDEIHHFIEAVVVNGEEIQIEKLVRE